MVPQNADDDEDLTPLALLEAAVEGLTEEYNATAQDREDRLRVANIYLGGAEADFEAMKRQDYPADEVSRFESRLDAARQQLDALQPKP